MIYRSGSALINENKQTIETNRIFFHKGNRAPFRIRYAQYASLLIPGLRPGIGRACNRSLKGRVVSRGLDLCCFFRRCSAKRTSQIHLNLLVWNLFSSHGRKPFFFPLPSRWSLISMWECENNRRYPERYKILTKTFYFQFVGSCRSPWYVVTPSVPFRFTRPGPFLL